jgi:hypothetical protein
MVPCYQTYRIICTWTSDYYYRSLQFGYYTRLSYLYVSVEIRIDLWGEEVQKELLYASWIFQFHKNMGFGRFIQRYYMFCFPLEYLTFSVAQQGLTLTNLYTFEIIMIYLYNLNPYPNFWLIWRGLYDM